MNPIQSLKERKIIIRKPKKSELEKVYRLGNSVKEFMVSDKIRYYKRREIKEFIGNNKSNIFLVAEHKNKIVGSLFAKIISCHWCMLDTICIKKSYQGKNIASQLLEKLFAILKRQKIYYVQGISEIDNMKARNYFKKVGFQEGRKFVWIEKFLQKGK